jgi:hypothetical protein
MRIIADMKRHYSTQAIRGRQRLATHKATKAKARKEAAAEYANGFAAQSRLKANRFRGKTSLGDALGAGLAMQQAAMAMLAGGGRR